MNRDQIAFEVLMKFLSGEGWRAAAGLEEWPEMLAKDAYRIADALIANSKDEAVEGDYRDHLAGIDPTLSPFTDIIRKRMKASKKT